MIRPVGVGFQSPGPTGVVGFTTTAGTAFDAASSTSCSASSLDRLYAPAISSSRPTVRSSANEPRRGAANVATLLV